MAKKRIKKSGLAILRPNAAGIDIASQIHYVAVPEGRAAETVRSFGSFTRDLHDLASWLKDCGIDTVAIESTGIYWVQLYLILEEYGLEVYLVNARHIKNVSGRKSDVLDCQWIQQLHSYGLLNKSFQPDDLTRELRCYMRHRRSLTEHSSTQILHMQKAFEQMNIKLHNVLSDITGKSGQSIIEAILSGVRRPEELVQYVSPKVKASKEDIIKSLEGNWREESVFELKQAYELYHVFRTKVRECDVQIEGVLKKIDSLAGNGNKHLNQKRVYSKNRLNFGASAYLQRIVGVDLTDVFGISELLATQIISETGIDMSKWPNKKHFTSWLNLAPSNRVSGGKMLRPKKSKKKNKAGQTFMMAAYALQRGDNWLGRFYRRIKAKHGAPVANKATARKIAIIFYNMVKNKAEFDPIAVDEYSRMFKAQKMRYVKKQALSLGYELVPV